MLKNTHTILLLFVFEYYVCGRARAYIYETNTVLTSNTVPPTLYALLNTIPMFASYLTVTLVKNSYLSLLISLSRIGFQCQIRLRFPEEAGGIQTRPALVM